MRFKLKNVLLFIMRSIFLSILVLVALARNMMRYIDSAEIGEIITLLNKYKSSFSLGYIDDKELFLYKLIYIFNEYYIYILAILFIIWITIEMIIIFTKKDRRPQNEEC